jgi:hypothetical protein
LRKYLLQQSEKSGRQEETEAQAIGPQIKVEAKVIIAN